MTTDNNDTTPVKTPEELLGMWADLRGEVEAIDVDMQKNLVKGNTAAGRRARAKFRSLKKSASNLVREMVKLDKARKASGE